jgi:septum site-determining protein MinC
MKTSTRPRLRLRGRSFIAISLAPVAPVAQWLAELDEQIERAPSFFADRPVVVDFAALPPGDEAVPFLVGELQTRGVRVIGVEGEGSERAAAPGWLWPAPLSAGRVLGDIDVPDENDPESAAGPPVAEQPTSLVIEKPVRSGQTVLFPEGDITVLGSVSSGAEIIAGGSIHVYGTLRGRAIAGFAGNPGARIFCIRLDAELLAIDGLYRTAEEMPASLIGKATQIWLEGDVLQMAPIM